MSDTLQRRILFVVMLLLGVVVGYVLPKPLRPATDQHWQQLFNEEEDHKRITAFQDALTKEGSPKDAVELSRQLDAQLRIEDLIVKSREAEYAKYTPFSAVFAAGFSVLGGIVGALITGFFTKKRVARTPTKET